MMVFVLKSVYQMVYMMLYHLNFLKELLKLILYILLNALVLNVDHKEYPRNFTVVYNNLVIRMKKGSASTLPFSGYWLMDSSCICGPGLPACRWTSELEQVLLEHKAKLPKGGHASKAPSQWVRTVD
jgi:uncharacterized protein YacL